MGVIYNEISSVVAGSTWASLYANCSPYISPDVRGVCLRAWNGEFKIILFLFLNILNMHWCARWARVYNSFSTKIVSLKTYSFIPCWLEKELRKCLYIIALKKKGSGSTHVMYTSWHMFSFTFLHGNGVRYSQEQQACLESHMYTVAGKW